MDSSAGEDEGATVINPAGNDAPAQLVVTVPSGVTVEPTKVTYANKTVDLGQSLGPIPLGQQAFTLSTDSPLYHSSVPSTAKFEAGKTTTIAAAALFPKAIGGPRTIGLEKDLITNWQIRILSGVLDRSADGTKGVPLLAGDYEVNYGMGGLDGVSFKVAPGEKKSVVLTDPATRRIARIQAPASRDRPSTACGNGGTAYNVSSGSSYAARVDLAPGETVDVGVSLRNEGARYRISAPAWAGIVDVPLGERGAGPKVYALGRIDVTDVQINGGPLVKGTYQIYPATASGDRAGGAFLSCNAATETGVDVPPGKWRVEVSYPSVDSGTKIDVHVVDVP
ncbi:MAG: hypothetical protein U0235_34805 [Polyangiaceae bacterium]